MSKVTLVVLVLIFQVLVSEVLSSGEQLKFQRVKRGAAYAGAYGGVAPKLSPSVALGAYGGFLRGGHPPAPNVHGSGGDIFNKEGHPGK